MIFENFACRITILPNRPSATRPQACYSRRDSQERRAVELTRRQRFNIDIHQASQVDNDSSFTTPGAVRKNMNSALFAETVIRKRFCPVVCQVFLSIEQSEICGRNFLQDGAAARAKRAIAPHRIGQIATDREYDVPAVAVSGILLRVWQSAMLRTI
jgi:hypothetical protein